MVNLWKNKTTRWLQSAAIFSKLYGYLQETVQISSRSIVAEYGIGKYGFGTFYLKKFSKVYGIDIEDYSARHPGVEFLLSDGDTIPLPNESVDLVVSHSVLEHVRDLSKSLTEINRILVVGGHAYLTVSPLYYSSFGSHVYEAGKRLDNWEHLDPTSQYFLTDNPIPHAQTSGHHLNKLTSSRFLASVGQQPWSILRYDLGLDPRDIPDYVDKSIIPELDLRIKDFKFIGQKRSFVKKI